jgi:HSP20 family protein
MRLPELSKGEAFPMLRGWFRDDFEKFFDEIAGRMGFPLRRAAEGRSFVPEVEVIEREGEFVVRAELPGIALEDVEVAVIGNALQIKGEKKEEKEESDENTYVCERSYGSFVRTIPIPAAVNEDKIEAKLEKGVLTISLPKTEKAKPKKVEIKGEAPKAPKSETPRPREEREREKK